MGLVGHHDAVGGYGEFVGEQTAVLGYCLGRVAAVLVDIESAVVALAESSVARGAECTYAGGYVIIVE